MFGGDAPCFGTFLAETRTSAETDAQLKDFALGDFNTCVPPDITTTSLDRTADFGQQVTDTATLSGIERRRHGHRRLLHLHADPGHRGRLRRWRGTLVGRQSPTIDGAASPSRRATRSA